MRSSSIHRDIKVKFRILTWVQNKLKKQSSIHLVLFSFCSFCNHSRIFFLYNLQGLSRVLTQEQLLAVLFSWTDFVCFYNSAIPLISIFRGSWGMNLTIFPFFIISFTRLTVVRNLYSITGYCASTTSEDTEESKFSAKQDMCMFSRQHMMLYAIWVQLSIFLFPERKNFRGESSRSQLP